VCVAACAMARSFVAVGAEDVSFGEGRKHQQHRLPCPQLELTTFVTFRICTSRQPGGVASAVCRSLDHGEPATVMERTGAAPDANDAATADGASKLPSSSATLLSVLEITGWGHHVDVKRLSLVVSLDCSL
jgi:hypothetical protein